MSCMSGSPNLNSFRDRGQVAVIKQFENNKYVTQTDYPGKNFIKKRKD